MLCACVVRVFCVCCTVFYRVVNDVVSNVYAWPSFFSLLLSSSISSNSLFFPRLLFSPFFSSLRTGTGSSRGPRTWSAETSRRRTSLRTRTRSCRSGLKGGFDPHSPCMLVYNTPPRARSPLNDNNTSHSILVVVKSVYSFSLGF